MKDSNNQLFNGLLIVLGAALLVYSLIVTAPSVYLQLLGLLLLMVGAYRASSYWAKHKDDHLNDK